MGGCQLKVCDAAKMISARYIGNDTEFKGVCTDTRNVVPGQLFVALKGPNFDGHQFVDQAQQAGAVALLVEKEVSSSLPQIVVEDTLKSLGELASQWREKFSIPLVAITGSNGKTSVKEMTKSIFSQTGNVLATRGNLNNHIGVPLMLLELDQSHNAAVIEMGANHPGEINYLTNLAHPTVAMINNAAAAHLEGFGSLEGVANAKGEIYGGLKKDGVAVVNADDKFAPLWASLTESYKRLTFGIEHVADVTCQWVATGNGNKLIVSTPSGNFDCELKMLGKHNVMNALAATACAFGAGIDISTIKAGLEAVEPVAGRLQTKPGKQGASVIDDTYNANPTSLRAAMEVLKDIEGDRFLVLGDMGELGDDSLEFHRQAGEQAKVYGFDRFFATGPQCREAVTAFGEGAEHFDDKQAMIDRITGLLSPTVTVLIKGSRSMKMEQVVNGLTDSGA